MIRVIRPVDRVGGAQHQAYGQTRLDSVTDELEISYRNNSHDKLELIDLHVLNESCINVRQANNKRIDIQPME